MAAHVDAKGLIAQVIFMQAYRWLIERALRRVRAKSWDGEDAIAKNTEKQA